MGAAPAVFESGLKDSDFFPDARRSGSGRQARLSQYRLEFSLAASLLNLMLEAAEAQESTKRGEDASASIWILRTNGEIGENARVMISCLHCLRTFPHSVGHAEPLIHKAVCPFSGFRAFYPIVQPLDPLTSQPYLTATAQQ
jgi:hypothetical protein